MARRDTSRTYFNDTTTVNDRANDARVIETLDANDVKESIRDLTATDLLGEILLELRKNNAYLAEMLGCPLNNSDIDL